MTNECDSIQALATLLKSSKSLVFFGGAGTSTESGIPDFRSKDGLYSTSFHNMDPEYLLSRECLVKEPEIFYAYLRSKLYYPNALPNKTHHVLSKLEQQGKLNAVITQNIDGLHQAAGSQNVIELHGSMLRASCMICKAPYPGKMLFIHDTPIPICPKCKGMLRPEVTLYGEPLDRDAIEAAATALSNADVLIVGGTSLAVYPAASYLSYFRGSTIVLMNRDATPIDKKASIIIRESIGAALSKAYELAFGTAN